MNLLRFFTVVILLSLVLLSACSKKETPEQTSTQDSAEPQPAKAEIEFPQGILLSELDMETLATRYRLSAISNGQASAFLEVIDGDTSGLAALGVKVRTFLGNDGKVIAARFPIDSLPMIVALPNVSLFMPDME